MRRGLVVATSLIAVQAAALGAQAADRYPRVRSFEVSARGVRAYWTDCAGDECYSLSKAHVWDLDRATGAWTAARDKTLPKRPNVDGDSIVPLRAGMRLVTHRKPSFAPTYTIDSAHGRTHWPLAAKLPLAERWRVARQDSAGLVWFYGGVPTLEQNITAFAAGRDAFWFGEFGQFAEPAEILRFDRKSHATTAFAEAPMAQTQAVALAVTGRALFFIGQWRGWLDDAGIGLARYDLASHTWRRFTAADSPLPDDDADAIASSGDSVFVATHDGIAIYDDATGKWTVRFFATRAVVMAHKDVVPGSGSTDENGHRQFEMADRQEIVPHWTLSARRPADNVRELAIVAAAAELSPQDSASPFAKEGIAMAPARFIALMRGVPVAHYDSATNRGGFDVEQVLSDARIVALAAASIKADSDGADVNQDVVGAVGRMGARQYLERLRAAVRRDSSLWSPNVAYTLAALGDSAGWAHLRAYVDEPLEPGGPSLTAQGYRYPSLQSAARLAMLGDTDVVNLLVRTLRANPGMALFELVHEAAPPAAWFGALRDAERNPAAVSEALRMLERLPAEELAPDAETRDAVLRLSRRAFELPPDFDSLTAYPPGLAPTSASQIILSLGDSGAIPSLIGAVGVDDLYIEAMVTLIKLTAVDSVPAPPKPTAAQRAEAQRFWREWWTSHQPTFKLPPAGAGVEALRRYRDRWVGSP